MANYETILGTVVTQQSGEGTCVMSMDDLSTMGVESGHISSSPIISGLGIVGADGFSHTSDYDATFLGATPTCASSTHSITAGDFQANGFISSWHFRYFRATDPNGNAFGYSTWFDGTIGPPYNKGLTTSTAVPIDTLTFGATPYGTGMTLSHHAPVGTPGVFTYELMQVPLPKIGSSYNVSVDMVAMLVPFEWNNGSSTTTVHCPKFFAPKQDITSLTCEQFPYYGVDSAEYWQEICPSGTSNSAATIGTTGTGNGFTGTTDWFSILQSFGNGKYYDITTGRCTESAPRTYYQCDSTASSSPYCIPTQTPTSYLTQSACEAQYPTGCRSVIGVKYYDCTQDSGTCGQVLGPSPYTSLADCQTAYPNGCETIPSEYWECHPDGGCVQVNGPTAYTSLEACQSAFPDGCDDPLPVIAPDIPCIEKYAYKSFCAIREHDCNNRMLCKDDDFIKFLKLLSLQSAGFTAADTDNNYVIDNITSLINLICECE